MPAYTYDPDGRVQPHAVIAEDSCDVTMRRNGDDGLFIKPTQLDSEGEFHLTVANIGQALRLLGFNRADVFPEG